MNNLNEERIKKNRFNDVSVKELKHISKGFFEDEGLTEVKREKGDKLRPRTFAIKERQNDPFILFILSVSLSGDYEDEILVKSTFDMILGYGYIIRTSTKDDDNATWIGYTKDNLKQDLLEAWLEYNSYLRYYEGKKNLDVWIRNLGLDRDEERKTTGNIYNKYGPEILEKLMTKEEFDKLYNEYKSSLNESRKQIFDRILNETQIEIYPKDGKLKAVGVTDKIVSHKTRDKKSDLDTKQVTVPLGPTQKQATNEVLEFLKDTGKLGDISKTYNTNPEPDITFNVNGDAKITPDDKTKSPYVIPAEKLD